MHAMPDNTASGWQIDHQCPQCGAPVVLEEADRILTCSFCRNRLYLSAGDHFRYHISAAPNMAGRDLLFIPYWHLKGMSFAFQGLEVSQRFVDASSIAVVTRGLPRSLGVRPQAMHVRFVSPQTAGQFLMPSIQVRGDALASSFTHPSQRLAFVGEAISVIYTPAYLEGKTLYDAVLCRPIAEWQPEHLESLFSLPREQGWQVQFIPTLCPQCGWDMEGERNALVLHCRNCSTAWRCANEAFTRIDAAFMASTGNPVVYLPFWKMRPRLEGIRLESYADLIRAANLPRAVMPALEEMPLFFWSPAFKVNPALFMRWARQMTLFQPEGDLHEELPKVPFHPVTLPAHEALESILVTLAEMVTDKRTFFHDIDHIHITEDECFLVYHPFAIGPRELIHETMGLTLDRRALDLGAQL